MLLDIKDIFIMALAIIIKGSEKEKDNKPHPESNVSKHAKCVPGFLRLERRAENPSIAHGLNCRDEK